MLITDGDETCGGAPCSVARTIARDTPEMVVHVIGYRIFTQTHDAELEPGSASPEAGAIQARCLADKTDGIYTVTRDVDGLITALRDTLGCAVVSSLPIERRAG